jgi:ubiquinone biosynthesis protein UbiJ
MNLESLLTCTSRRRLKGEIALMDLRKFNYNINVRSDMKEMGAEVLAGRADCKCKAISIE